MQLYAKDDYLDALSKLNTTVTKAHSVNPKIKFEVFIHKVDGLSDDTKMETQRDIHQRATDDLVESGLEQQASAAMNIFKGRYAALGTLLNY